MGTSETFPLADIELARRLERAEARGNARFVELRAQLDPSRGAAWVDVAGTFAMFDGVGSPVTQTFGLGMFAAPTTADFEAIESFFQSRGADIDHEVSPLGDPATLALLNARGYRPIEFTSVMYQPVPSLVVRPFQAASGVVVRVIGVSEAEVWAATAAEGWGMPPGGFMRDVARINAGAPDGHLFLAELDGRPAATGVLAIHGGVAHLAGASTIPSARGRGAQLALLDARLRYSAEHGCDLALMGAAPGGGSQRNAERNGFRIAYTRVKWKLKAKRQNQERAARRLLR